MYEFTQADMIWNRACGDDPLRTLPGDRALRDMIQAHGLVMNGGVFHAVECLTADQLSAAQDGFRFYELEEAASLLTRARQLFEADENLGEYEHELDVEYAAVIPSDSSLAERFEDHLRSSPSAYAALRAQDKE
jgi:hypothetical protein